MVFEKLFGRPDNDFKVGDTVGVSNIAYQGIGVIVEYSDDLSTGPGTP